LLSKYDKNKDGKIYMRKQQLVKEQAFRKIMMKHTEMKTAPTINLLTKSNDRRYPFILPAISQNTLVKRYNYYVIGLIMVFFSAGAFADWILTYKNGNERIVRKLTLISIFK